MTAERAERGRRGQGSTFHFSDSRMPRETGKNREPLGRCSTFNTSLARASPVTPIPAGHEGERQERGQGSTFHFCGSQMPDGSHARPIPGRLRMPMVQSSAARSTPASPGVARGRLKSCNRRAGGRLPPRLRHPRQTLRPPHLLGPSEPATGGRQFWLVRTAAAVVRLTAEKRRGH